MLKVFVSPLLDDPAWPDVRLQNIAVAIEDEETLLIGQWHRYQVEDGRATSSRGEVAGSVRPL